MHTELAKQLQEIAALPADRPMSMPGAFYTSASQFEHEAATVLRRGWHCLGRSWRVRRRPADRSCGGPATGPHRADWATAAAEC